VARLTNETDQAAIVLEVSGRAGIAPEWIGARMGMQYYVEDVNAFHTFAEAKLRIHEGDLKRLADHLRGLIDTEDDSKNFHFEPQVLPALSAVEGSEVEGPQKEPGFAFSCARLAPDKPFHFAVEAALDLKTFVPGSPAAAPRENRLTLKLVTTEGRMERFLAEVLKEMDTVLMG